MCCMFQISVIASCSGRTGVKLSKKVNVSGCMMKRRSCASKRSRRRAKDEAVTSYWNSQRVVPTKVDGKATYVVIPTGPSSDEYDIKGCSIKRQGIFPPDVAKHSAQSASYSNLHRHTVSKHRVVDMEASHDRSDIRSTDSKGDSKDCRSHLTSSSNGEDLGVVNLAQNYERQMYITEKPLTAHDNGEISTDSSNTLLQNTSKRSVVEVQQSPTSSEQDDEESMDFLGPVTVISE